MELDPNTILIENRQRKTKIDVSAEFVASIRERIIHPIVLRKENDKILLVVGERRLTAMKLAQINPIVEGNHFRFIDDLSSEDAAIAELEENTQRIDLHWRDRVEAIGTLHNLLNGTITKTADRIHMHQSSVTRILFVFRNLEKPALKDATSADQAYSILQQMAERRAVAAVEDITKLGTQAFSKEPKNDISSIISPSNDGPLRNSIIDVSKERNTSSLKPDIGNSRTYISNAISNNSPTISNTVLNLDFRKWATTYSGEKFTFIHCDFPYDVAYASYAKSLSSTDSDYDYTGFWPLLDCLLNNLDKLASYSSHLMIWFGMEFYQKTKTRLEEAGLFVHAHPFVWLKSDNVGIIPGREGMYPRRIYETAFLCTRGRRPLVKQKANAFSGPTPTNSIHVSQKSVAMLRHFFSMTIDETTRVLDPTCGSGSALIAAEEEKAKEVIGLEINSDYAKTANAEVLGRRRLREFSK